MAVVSVFSNTRQSQTQAIIITFYIKNKPIMKKLTGTETETVTGGGLLFN